MHQKGLLQYGSRRRILPLHCRVFGFLYRHPKQMYKEFFQDLKEQGFLWGFVSGAEPSSAKYVLENRGKGDFR